MNYLINNNSFLGIYIFCLFGAVIEAMKLHVQRRSVEEKFMVIFNSLLHFPLLVMNDNEGPLLFAFNLDAPRKILEWCNQGKI